MDGFSIKIEGAKELQDALKGLEPALSKKIIKAALKRVGAKLLADVKARAPIGSPDESTDPNYKPGFLRDSLVSKVSMAKSKVSVTVGSNDKLYTGNNFYLAFNELGTSHQEAKPFLRPALEDNKDSIREDVTNEIIEGFVDLGFKE